jgi:hypothetical protein
MPTLILDDKFNAIERSILQKTFRFSCEALKIEKFDASVYVMLHTPENPRQRGAVCRSDEKEFLLHLSSLNNIATCASATSHETVHIAQHLRGDLSPVEHFFEGVGILWKGKFFSQSDIAPPTSINDLEGKTRYVNLPWEKEAFAFQHRFDEVFPAIVSREEGLYILNDFSRQGLRKAA